MVKKVPGVCIMTFDMVTRIVLTAAKVGWVNPDEAMCLASHSGSIRVRCYLEALLTNGTKS